MPRIAVKGFPRGDETMRKVAGRSNAALRELWGCRQEHVNISRKTIAPEERNKRFYVLSAGAREHGRIREALKVDPRFALSRSSRV